MARRAVTIHDSCACAVARTRVRVRIRVTVLVHLVQRRWRGRRGLEGPVRPLLGRRRQAFGGNLRRRRLSPRCRERGVEVVRRVDRVSCRSDQKPSESATEGTRQRERGAKSCPSTLVSLRTLHRQARPDAPATGSLEDHVGRWRLREVEGQES